MGLSLATFNVKDLLEPTTPAALEAWPAKVEWIAQAIAACDADVVGLQEIGSAGVLLPVLDRPVLRGRYLTPLMGTTDARGIGCALLSRLPLLATRVHTASSLPFPVFREGDAPPFGTRIPLRRGIVHAQIDASALGPVDVFVAHFKSSRPVRLRDAQGVEQADRTARDRAEGVVRGVVWRAAEALFVRGLVDAVLADRPDAMAAVVGDLNDVFDSAPLRALRGDAPGTGTGDGGALLDCTGIVPPEGRFSTLHDGRRGQIDHVLATSALHARLQSAEFHNAALREHEPSGEVPTVDSDHAPLVVRFG